jgi:hypothetical protein
MKLFAITPDNASIDQLLARLPEIQHKGATHLYLRLSVSNHEVHRLIEATALAGIVPVVPYINYKRDNPGNCGVHYKSSEINLLAQSLPERPLVITVSTHSSVEVQFALQAGANYIYVSPVFEPLSKHNERQLFPHTELRNLIATHGERIVLLGGMTVERIKTLAEDFKCDFSAAGITIFFGGLGG